MVILITLIIVIAGSIIVMVSIGMISMQNEYESLLDVDVKINEEMMSCYISSLIPARNIRDALLIPDRETNNDLITDAETNLEMIDEYLENMEKIFPVQLDKALFYEFKECVQNWASNLPIRD